MGSRLLFVDTHIRGSVEFAPQIGTADLQDWLDQELPYALLDAVQPVVEAVEVAVDAVAEAEAFDVDAVD